MFYQYVCTLRAKPHRPYKSFFKAFSAESTEPTLATPTPASPAEAKARSRTQESHPDPVEGYRYANYINCPECESSGKGTQAACGKAYQRCLQEYRRQESEFERLAKARKEALRTLTKEQIQALRELGV